MLVVKQHKKLLLNLRDPDRVTAIMPTAKAVVVKGNTLVAVPHRDDEVRVLRNLGFDPPSPLATYYTWPGKHKPFQHQVATAEFLSINPRAFCLNGMGSGKTLAVLWAFDYLRKADIVDWMLVISPLSTLERAWGDEIFQNFFDMTFAVLHGTREKRHQLLATPFDVYIINHDGIKHPATKDLIINKPGRGLIVVDEIAAFRNARTERWKALNGICNGKTIPHPRHWVWGLTGTPTPNAPTDAWAQTRIISPGRAPGYFGAFEDLVMNSISKFKKVAKPSAMQTVSNMMQPAIRFSREECIDLPPTTYVTRQVDLTSEQKHAYNDMLQRFKAEYEGGQITAANEAVKAGKLIQICCGVAYGKGGEDIIIPAQPRIDLCKEIIEEAGGKVIIFVPLTGALEKVAEELNEIWPTAVVHGATPKGQRDAIFKAFQTTKEPHVIVANAGTMSHGLTLTAADTIVWFAPTNSNEIYQQANMRIVRPGQKRNTLIVAIESTPLERKMYDRLAGKGKLQGVLLDLIKEMK
jgi:SNF2 family DNA or RNA helicase